MREIILMSFAGPDRPSLSASLMQVLASHSVNILDVGQAVIHDQLSLGVVVESPLHMVWLCRSTRIRPDRIGSPRCGCRATAAGRGAGISGSADHDITDDQRHAGGHARMRRLEGR